MFRILKKVAGRRAIGGVPIVSICLLLGVSAGVSVAQLSGPAEHKGLSVETLGVIDEAMLNRQIGLDGYFLQMRAITIEPGGQIAEHSHQNRPGLVKVISGEWIEGRPVGEATYSNISEGILEDAETVHWFYNHTESPATAIVCDLSPVQ